MLKSVPIVVLERGERDDVVYWYLIQEPLHRSVYASLGRVCTLRKVRTIRGCYAVPIIQFYLRHFSTIWLLFITAVPNTKLCVWGEEDSGGHVL